MMIEFLAKGGIMMIPIALCSVLAVAIIVERAVRFARTKNDSEELVAQIKHCILSNKFEEAMALCQHSQDMVARLLEEVIRNRHRPPEDLEKTISLLGSRYLQDLSKYLRGLGVIGNITPLMGLLGTVLGMVKAFMKVAHLGGKVNPSILASGIWEALLTTAAGLSVAIPVLLVYHYLEGKVDEYAFRMQNASMEILQTLKGQAYDRVYPEKEG
ncbi:MAG: MotA/TolQ/ExbB proton channel family protein [Nitrospinota bacterium]|nr:MAG: MotA/TolQ/ExbB proton channel family protein [Nitrospinota bacterium]